MLKDSIHYRGPLSWRGKVRSRPVRKWFKELEEGQGTLAPNDPDPGPLELSVRLPRGALNRAAKLYGASGTTLLRRLIAAHVEPRESPPPRATAVVPSGVVSRLQSEGTRPVRAQLPLSASGPVLARSEASGAKPLSIVGTVERFRSLEEIGQAMRQGIGITSEELIRWQAVHERR